MCIGNTTSPAANNTTNVRYGGWGNPDEWERPEVIDPQSAGSEFGAARKQAGKRQALKTPAKSQSSKTSGGTY